VLEIRVLDVDLFRNVTPQIRIDDVGHAHEAFEDFTAGGLSEIQIDTRFVPVERLEKQAIFALLEGRYVSADVAATAGLFDLDHIGAKVSQVNCPERTGSVLFQSDDPNVRQRLHGLGSRVLPSVLKDTSANVTVTPDLGSTARLAS